MLIYKRISCCCAQINILYIDSFSSQEWIYLLKTGLNMIYLQIIQARIAQLVAYQPGTGEVPGSNPGKGENFSVKISNSIVRF